METWLLLSIPIVYLLRTTFGAAVYIIGTMVWLFSRQAFLAHASSPMLFWVLLFLAIPYFLIRFRENRDSRETATLAIVLTIVTVFGVGFTTDFAKSNLGGVAFAGLLTAIYLCGIKFFPRTDERLHIVALLGGIGIGVTAIVLSFESSWHMTHDFNWNERTAMQNVALALELACPLLAIGLAALDIFRRRFQFSIAAAAFPIVTAIAWGIANLCQSGHSESRYRTDCTFAAAALINAYALWLGIDILIRGIRTNSIARANFGLLLIAALALSRFFDSDLSFVTRGVGFILVGAGFLVANVLMFKKRSALAAS